MSKLGDLREKLATLKGLKLDSVKPEIEKVEAEIAKLEEKEPAEDSAPGNFGTIPADKEDYEKASSKFPQAGNHVSEFGMPRWKQVNVSLEFPFTIIEGQDEGKEGSIFSGISKDSLFKIRQILDAVGEKPVFNKKGDLDLDKTLPKVFGKRAKTVWIMEPDKRTTAEGGTGKSYVKCDSAISLEAETPAEV